MRKRLPDCFTVQAEPVSRFKLVCRRHLTGNSGECSHTAYQHLEDDTVLRCFHNEPLALYQKVLLQGEDKYGNPVWGSGWVEVQSQLTAGEARALRAKPHTLWEYD